MVHVLDAFDPRVQEKKKPKKRWDFLLHRRVRQLTMMPIFSAFMMLIILINSLVIGLETNEDLKKNRRHIFVILDTVFIAIYTIEFALKVYAEPKCYWHRSYNLFDFFLLVLDYVQELLDNLKLLEVDEGALKILRLLRVATLLRTISFVEGLQVLVSALIVTIRKSVLNVVALLILLMVFFGVVGYYIFGYDEAGDKERWGSLSTAMLTLFTFVTVDGWTGIQRRLDAKFSYSQWFTIIFIFLGHFIFTNLFIGIIIMNIHDSTERYNSSRKLEREAILQLKKDYLYKRQREDVQHMLEKQRNSKYANFAEMTRNFRGTLRHDDYVIMTDVSCGLTWLETYIDSLDHLDKYSHRCQQSHFNMANVISELLERKIRLASSS